MTRENRIKIATSGTITTSADGSASATTVLPMNGRIVAVVVDLGTASSVTLKITPVSYTGSAFEIVNATFTSDDIIYPRVPVNDKSDNELTYDGTRKVYEMPMIKDKLLFTISGAGSSKTLKVIVYYV